MGRNTVAACALAVMATLVGWVISWTHTSELAESPRARLVTPPPSPLDGRAENRDSVAVCPLPLRLSCFNLPFLCLRLSLVCATCACTVAEALVHRRRAHTDGQWRVFRRVILCVPTTHTHARAHTHHAVLFRGCCRRLQSNMVISVLAMVATYWLVPQCEWLFLKANLSGRDLNKVGVLAHQLCLWQRSRHRFSSTFVFRSR